MSEHPEKLSEVKDLKVSEDLKEFVIALNQDIDESVDDRADWNTRQDIYFKHRYGIKKKKTFPWPGAANFVLPQIDSDINRLKPSYVNLAYNVSPVVTFEPYGAEDIEPARKREKLFDWRLRTQVNFFDPYVLGIEYMLQYGFVIFKTQWKFATRKYTDFLSLEDLGQEVVEALLQPEVTDEVLFQIIAEELRPDLTFQENVDEINSNIDLFRQGASEFEFNFCEASDDRAEVIACNPREEITFPSDTRDIQKARFIDYKFKCNLNDIKIAMKDGKYRKFSEDDMSSWTGVDSDESTFSKQLRRTRDGINSFADDDTQVILHEVCTWYDIDDDGIEERVIITYPDKDPSSVLRFIEVPYDHGQFPYTVVRREYNDSTILSSRGIPQIDDDFQMGISTIFNQDIDAGTITNTPTIVSRKNSIKNLRNLRYIPGQQLETENGPADVSILQQGNAAQANRFNNMQYLKGWANERIGNISAAFSSPVNAPGLSVGGKKSATEVEAIASHEGQLQSLDLQIFQQQMKNVYYQIDALYNQFGSDEEVIAITNEKPIRISRQEIQGKFNMVPNGRMDDANPNMRLRKAFLMAQTVAQLDPEFSTVNKDELLRYTMNEIDNRISNLIIKSPEQQAQEEQARAMAIANQKEAIKSDALQMKQAEERIEANENIRKEAILAPIQGKKYAEG